MRFSGIALSQHDTHVKRTDSEGGLEEAGGPRNGRRDFI